MYLLIRIGTNDIRTSELVSKSKKSLENYIKEKGFYWSKKFNRYILLYLIYIHSFNNKSLLDSIEISRNFTLLFSYKTYF